MCRTIFSSPLFHCNCYGICNIQFQMTVENWVYDQKIDVDVMQLFAFAGEETIPDEDLSDPNSPVVTLDGRDIAQGYTISKSMFDEELGKWSENLKAVITPRYAPRNWSSVRITPSCSPRWTAPDTSTGRYRCGRKTTTCSPTW